MCRKSVSYHNMNSVGDSVGMRFLIKTGILVFLITSVIGRAFHEERNEAVNITSYDEEPSENNCNCEWRYYKHYEAKGCQVVQVDSCGCPKKYVCPLRSNRNEEQKTCIYQNQEYKLGSRINITDKCQFCRCLGGEEPQMTCRHKECPQLDSAGDKNCHLVYEKDQCCPSKYECVMSADENEAAEEDSFCMYNGITYPLGAKIYPPEDPCLICECSETWSGLSNSSCYQQDCLFEKNKKLFDKGCVPVYHENKCCPIEFYCPEAVNINNNIPLENDLIEENLEGLDHNCIFGGKLYEIGMELLMKNPCIRCNCVVPPDFTCVHQSCPPPPSVEKCEVVHSTNYCCPSYQCFNDDMPTNDVSNSSEIDCPTPVCADSTCEIKIPEGHLCPTCICEESAHEINILEPNEDLIMEGSLKNGSSPETEEFENENFDSEVLIPIESEFSNQNTNMSEKFVDDSNEKEHLEYDEIEVLEDEIDKSTSIFEKGIETFDSDEPLREQIGFVYAENAGTNSSINDSKDVVMKVLRKRSTDFRNANNALNQAQPQQNNLQLGQNQQQFFEEEEDTESDREILENGSDEGFDELKLSSMSKKNGEKVEDGGRRLDEEDLISSESIIVPAGCPTPLCANSSCKIEIPIGHRCPTCVCKSRENWQP